MQTKLISAKVDRTSTPLLVVFALDTSDKKQGKPAVKLLTSDKAVAKATVDVMGSGEFSAGSCETVLLHAPDGLKAERLLIVGLGKLTTQELRKGAGTAVRFAKPRKIRKVTISPPEGLEPLSA